MLTVRFAPPLARRLRRVLEPRGYAVAPLQAPRVQELLGLPPDKLLLEMRGLTSGGEVIGGADAIVFLARGRQDPALEHEVVRDQAEKHVRLGDTTPQNAM